MAYRVATTTRFTLPKPAINYSMRAAFSVCISRREHFLLSLITVGQVSAPGEDFTALLNMPFNRRWFTHTLAIRKRRGRLISKLAPILPLEDESWSDV